MIRALICCCEVNGAYHRIGCSHCLAFSCASSFHAHMLLSANISTTTRSCGSHTRCLLQKSKPRLFEFCCNYTGAFACPCYHETDEHRAWSLLALPLHYGMHVAHCFTCATTVRLCKARDTPLADTQQRNARGHVISASGCCSAVAECRMLRPLSGLRIVRCCRH